MTLDKLRPGERAVVMEIDENPLKRRLQELGLSEGSEISCLFASPLGDPIAYRFASSVIAIRMSDSKSVRSVSYTHLMRNTADVTGFAHRRPR